MEIFSKYGILTFYHPCDPKFLSVSLYLLFQFPRQNFQSMVLLHIIPLVIPNFRLFLSLSRFSDNNVFWKNGKIAYFDQFWQNFQSMVLRHIFSLVIPNFRLFLSLSCFRDNNFFWKMEKSPILANFGKIIKVWCSYIYDPCDTKFSSVSLLSLTNSEIGTFF